MRKTHTEQCRWEAIKGGFWMIFVSASIGLLAPEIPHHIHIEPAKVKYVADKASSMYLYVPGNKELY